MAVRTSNFQIAASKAEEAPPTDENVAELNHGDGIFSLWREPTPGAFSMFQLRISRTKGNERAKGVDLFFSRLILTPEEVVRPGRIDGDGVEYAERVKELKQTPVGIEQVMEWIEAGVIKESALLDMLAEVVELHAGFPTSPASDSSGSQTESGPSSTARSRRVGSTPSS